MKQYRAYKFVAPDLDFLIELADRKAIKFPALNKLITKYKLI